MKLFILNNYRGIFHIICMLEFIFFAWLYGVNPMYSLNPDDTIFKLVMLPLIFIVAQWSLKVTKLDKMFEEEKEKLLNKKNKTNEYDVD